MVDCAGLENRKHGGATSDLSATYDDTQNCLPPSLSPAESMLDLADLIRAWPDLPPAIRAGIMAMVKAVK